VTFLAPATARAQPRPAAAAIQALRQAILEAEDRRAPTDAEVKTLLDGTRHPSEAVQRMAVRALAGSSAPRLWAAIEPALSSTFGSVRAAAAEALGQAAVGAATRPPSLSRRPC